MCSCICPGGLWLVFATRHTGRRDMASSRPTGGVETARGRGGLLRRYSARWCDSRATDGWTDVKEGRTNESCASFAVGWVCRIICMGEGRQPSGLRATRALSTEPRSDSTPFEQRRKDYDERGPCCLLGANRRGMGVINRTSWWSLRALGWVKPLSPLHIGRQKVPIGGVHGSSLKTVA